MLLIRCDIKDEKLEKYERSFHLVSLVFGGGTALTALFNGWYSNSLTWCCLAEVDDAHTYRWAFYFGPLLFCTLCVSCGMFAIYRGVYIKGKETARYQLESRRVLVSPYLHASSSNHVGGPPRSSVSTGTDRHAGLKWSMSRHNESRGQATELLSLSLELSNICDDMKAVTKPARPPDRFPERPPKPRTTEDLRGHGEDTTTGQEIDKEAKKRLKFEESVAKQSMLREMAARSKRKLSRTRHAAMQALLYGRFKLKHIIHLVSLFEARDANM